MKLHPFVKWVGGKTQLLNEITDNIPDRTEVYVEPFVGGGAVLFDVLEKKPRIEVVIINDANTNLMNAYNCIVHDCDMLIDELSSLAHNFIFADDKEKFYYEQRKKYNDNVTFDWMRCLHANLACEQAARFMFLNKTCFNGLYRVNKKGKFNVPYNGTQTVSFDYDNLKNISTALNKKICLITNHSYDHCEIMGVITQEKNPNRLFIYLDPPYRPIKVTGSEVSYTKSGFNDNEQRSLKLYCDYLTERKIKFIQSNSDPEDKFFDKLYDKYYIKRIQARRSINSDGTKRGKINELLISNFKI